MVSLLRADGSTVSYTTEEAEAILARLVAADLNSCVGQDDVAHVRAGNTLYLVDVAVQYNRKLLEQFTITYSAVNAFNLSFNVGSVAYDIHAALPMAGYVGTVPIDLLATIYWAEYIGAPNTYVSPGQLVVSSGVFNGAPAELKPLQAGDNITIAEPTDAIVISSTSDVTQADLDAVISQQNTNTSDIALNR